MTLHQAAQKAVGALAKEQILHLWDMHVGEPTEHAPLTDKDKLAFARAVLYAAASPSTTQQPSVDHALNTTPVVDHATQQQEAGSDAEGGARLQWTGSDGAHHEVIVEYALQIMRWVFDKWDVPEIDAMLAAAPSTPAREEAGVQKAQDPYGY